MLNDDFLDPASKPEETYVQVKRSTFQTAYADSFSSDLEELRGFTQTFIENVDSLNVLCKRFRDIPVDPH